MSEDAVKSGPIACAVMKAINAFSYCESDHFWWRLYYQRLIEQPYPSYSFFESTEDWRDYQRMREAARNSVVGPDQRNAVALFDAETSYTDYRTR